MDIENPIALHFIMQDELFFLKEDRVLYAGTETTSATTEPLTVAYVTPVEEPTPVKFNFKGNKGELLILVHYPDTEFINETHLTALENILKRKGSAIDDIAILNLAKHSDINFEAIEEYFAAQKILVLGEKALPEGITPLKLNTPTQSGKSMLLYSFSFDEMMDSPENKKAFWEQMKLF